MKQILLKKKLSFSESIEIAIRLYISNFFYIFVMTSYFFIPYILLRIFLFWQILPLDINTGLITYDSSASFQTFIEIFSFCSFFIIIFLLVLCFFTLILACNGLLLQHRFSFQHCLQTQIKKLKTILVNSYLFGFIFIFIFFISFNFTGFGFIIPFAVLLPFIYFPHIILFEQIEYLHAFRRSAQIVKYRYLFFFFIIVFISFAVIFIANAPSLYYLVPKVNTLITSQLGPQKVATPADIMQEFITILKNMPLYLIGFSLLLEFLLFPILPILITILYQNTIAVFEKKQNE